ncbi:helix-turn-helix domain-containing protein [Streptomyces noursei]|uniref:helix-turn-helix domain-containing protein n=1 Tax=Streptomyces noursei TaxID=1971 RepID=UPI0016772481|nr:helix-turn-helix domain-containing protein [Streptomyces noursei]MCZ1020586.1 helix-turn-helix domain-containing protein [Streptomyces noursei]GGX12640.1 MarR family transcriptional regulator [Streptomyces noursei]
MPGRRLTRAERQQIAAGLAQRLNYADIARRLDRPTSTVSREVARNGGPARYRAELAQLATSHRARRRPQPPASAQRTIEHLGPDADATAAFVTDLTAALVQTGLPRTAARVMACLFASETGSRTAIEMAQHLHVSAATISQAVHLLQQQNLIRRGRDDRSRRHRYFLDDNAGLRTVVASVAANQRLAATALRGADVFGAQTAAGTRLALAGRFLERLGDDLIRSAEKHWRDMVGDGVEEHTLTIRTTHASTE